jgi:hypothetical protein
MERRAGIHNSTGHVTAHRKHNKPALGLFGDLLDDAGQRV